MRQSRLLERRTPLRADVDASAGYAFALGLSEAICTVTDGLRDALAYKGIDVSPAVQRALYIDLVNRPELYDAFRGEGQQVPVANEVEAGVVRALCPFARLELLERPRVVEALARARRRLRSRSATRRGPIRRGGALALLIHPKLTTFIRPLVDRLPGGYVTAVSMFETNDPDLVPVVPDWSAASAGLLRGYPELVALVALFDALIVEVRPAVVIGIEGNTPPDAALAAVARARGVPTVVLQQGWPPLLHAGFRGIGFDRMLVWGQGFADALAPFNPGLRFVDVGSHVVGPLRPVDEGNGAASFFLQTTSELIAPQHVEQLLELAVGVAATPGTTVLVREHPGHPMPLATRELLEHRGGITLTDASRFRLDDVLGRSAVAVSIYSTTLFEAVAAGVPAVSFNPTSLPGLMPSLVEYGAGIEARDLSTAHEAILNVLRDPGIAEELQVGMERMRRDYFSAVGHAAAMKAAEAILMTAESRGDSA